MALTGTLVQATLAPETGIATTWTSLYVAPSEAVIKTILINNTSAIDPYDVELRIDDDLDVELFRLLPLREINPGEIYILPIPPLVLLTDQQLKYWIENDAISILVCGSI